MMMMMMMMMMRYWLNIAFFHNNPFGKIVANILALF